MDIKFISDGKEFKVECGQANCDEVVYLNGKEVSRKKNCFNLKSSHIFSYEGKSYEIKFELIVFRWSISMKLLRGSEELHNQTVSVWRMYFPADNVSTTKWGYVFVFLCGVIPFISLGGAIPALLGLSGAVSCYRVSKKQSFSLVLRLVLCLGITTACWVLFIALIQFMSASRSQ